VAWKLLFVLAWSLIFGCLTSLIIPLASASVISENSRRKFFFEVVMMIFEVAVKLWVYWRNDFMARKGGLFEVLGLP
jgi:hypothetical protein